MRTKFMGIITCPGCCPGIDANMRPIAAKQKADSSTPKPSDITSVITDWKNRTPTIIGIVDIPNP